MDKLLIAVTCFGLAFAGVVLLFTLVVWIGEIKQWLASRNAPKK